MEHGIVSTHSTPYHPAGNGQCERENGTIWKAVRLALRTRGWPETQWESVLDIVLHSIRSLLCTATNQTPHERLFSHPRKSGNGYSLPEWLTPPGPVMLRKFVRRSKSDPLVEMVDLISVTPHYACVRYPDGRESTVSTRDLAPAGETIVSPAVEADLVNHLPSETEANVDDSGASSAEPEHHDLDQTQNLGPPPMMHSTEPLVRRSTRTKRPPIRLDL